ncbi:MAG: hypothetical protein KGL39_26380 [Patescibacteria group bacterium]|nr:hypothetical protein [Patescibacteria group bacterium]
MPIQSTVPVGTNFADGVMVLPAIGGASYPSIVGTPLPTADLQTWTIHGKNVTGIEEPPPYPIFERAEQATCQHKVLLSRGDALFFQGILGRGLVVTDTYGQVWKVLSSKSERSTHGMAWLEYVMESISFDSPPDDFSITPMSLDLNIIKHPRYAWALSPYVSDNSTYVTVGDTQIFYTQVKESIIRGIQNYIESPMYPTTNIIGGYFQDNVLAMCKDGKIVVSIPNPNYVAPNGYSGPALESTWDGKNSSLANISTSVRTLKVTAPADLSNPSNPIAIGLAAANELLTKLWRGEDTPYVPGYLMSWTQRFYHPIYINGGAYIEDPRNVVPYYFLNPATSTGSFVPRGNQGSFGPVPTVFGSNSDTWAAGGSGSSTIFDALRYINPQCFTTNGIYGGPLSFSALRMADRYRYDRTIFEVQHQWQIAPVGRWDSDLFTKLNRPQLATDFGLLPNSFGD